MSEEGKDSSETQNERFDRLAIEIYLAVEYGDMKKAREILWKEIQDWR